MTLPMARNPMFEFVGAQGYKDEHRSHKVDSDFEEFKGQHGRDYDCEKEEAKRKTHFRHNHRWADPHTLTLYCSPFPRLHPAQLTAPIHPLATHPHTVPHSLHIITPPTHSFTITHQHQLQSYMCTHPHRYIHSMNRRDLSYKLKVNHMTDYSDEEISRMRGYRHTPDSPRGKPYQPSLKDVPTFYNWRLRGTWAKLFNFNSIVFKNVCI